MITLRIVFILLLIPALAFSRPRKEIPFIFLKPNQVLYITVIDNIYDGGDEYDRYHYIEETLEKVLSETEFPMGYKIGRFGWRVPRDQPELQLHILKWGNTGFGEIEVRLNASLKETSQGRSRNKLGFFRHADGGAAIFSSTRMIAKYNEILSKALYKLMAELNEHFEVEFDDPNLKIQPLSPSLGAPIGDR